jgi:hypothetical protein
VLVPVGKHVNGIADFFRRRQRRLIGRSCRRSWLLWLCPHSTRLTFLSLHKSTLVESVLPPSA